jgi:hypothetical protein
MLDDFIHEPRVAYFSMEIALRNDTPTCSGGLGILAGDTIRSAADLGVPVVAVSLVSRLGYFRQQIDDHNGFSHRDPGFIDHVVNKKVDVNRVYLPPDANTLLLVADQCLRSRDFVNVIVADKQPQPQWLAMDAAVKHCTAASASGNGRATTTMVNRTSSWRVPATCRPWKRSRRSTCCASTCPG